jgi:hypothetical protein
VPGATGTIPETYTFRTDSALREIEHFDPRQGGRFKIILTFSATTGKSSRHSDVVQGRFLRIVQAVEFASDRPEFAGTMTINGSLSATRDGTLVTIIAEDVPIGISRADHELGMASKPSDQTLRRDKSVVDHFCRRLYEPKNCVPAIVL